MPTEPRPTRPLEKVWLVASAGVPALVAAAQLDPYASGGRGGGVVRAVGFGYDGAVRPLDVWLGGLFAELPLGTRTLRAELPGILLLAVVAGLLFILLRRLLGAASAPSSRWCSIVAALATAAASLGYPFQHEAASPASSHTGLVIVLAALVHVGVARRSSGALLAGLFTLGLTYDPAVGASVAVVALCAVAAPAITLPVLKEAAARPPGGVSGLRRSVEALLAAAAGVLPFMLATAHARITALSTSAQTFASPSDGDHLSASLSVGARGHYVVSVLRSELGDVLVILAVAGLVLALASSTMRLRALPSAAFTGVSVAALALSYGGSAPSSVGALPVLLVLTGALIFAGVAMHELVVRVSRAKVPLAAASAAMVIVLEAAFPAILLDDALARLARRQSLALPLWEDAAFAGLPGGSEILVSSPRLYLRLLATEAGGQIPIDMGLLPTFDPSNEAAARALSRDARFVPLFRDLLIFGAPAELSMSTLAGVTPLVLAADPGWDRSLSRHLIPAGLLALFEPEPRGGADRKHALEASAPARVSLAKALGLPAPPNDPPLAQLTAALLLDRALGEAGTGEREVALRALEDAALFAPNDPALTRVTLLVSRGRPMTPVDVRELMREGLAGGSP